METHDPVRDTKLEAGHRNPNSPNGLLGRRKQLAHLYIKNAHSVFYIINFHGWHIPAPQFARLTRSCLTYAKTSSLLLPIHPATLYRPPSCLSIRNPCLFLCLLHRKLTCLQMWTRRYILATRSIVTYQSTSYPWGLHRVCIISKSGFSGFGPPTRSALIEIFNPLKGLVLGIAARSPPHSLGIHAGGFLSTSQGK